MGGSPDIALRIRPLEEHAAAEDRLSPLAKVHHAHSLGPQRIALPPMPIGETFLARWPVDLTPVRDGETLVAERLLYPLSVHGLAAYHPCLDTLFGGAM